MFVFVSCKETKEKENSSLEQDKTQVTFDKKLLNGAWAENQEENALFYIENDSIYYIDNQDKPYSLEFRGSYFSIHYDNYTSKAELIKLTKDDMIYKSSTGIIKLYRRADQVKEAKTETKETLLVDNNKKCDMEKVTVLKQQLPSASKESILSFLSTISVDCKNNAEFGQFSNEVLFEVLKAKPIEVLMIVEKENVEKDEVYKMLENPINDAINLNKLIDSINKLELQSVEKSKFLEALKKALEKYN
ncbi:hypothetical protein [Aquimarina aggregata]|uniref:hypothetical protein n=1 Tax=Aquimarina aggregata TaxID=1642818 RepID=UPI002492A815|nr:hypothetical protein [Aquimarina aggregata]